MPLVMALAWRRIADIARERPAEDGADYARKYGLR